MVDDHSEYGSAASRFYDSTYELLREGSGDREFYRELARQSGGGPVLELGCGSGRVLLPIARDGIESVGLDASPDMLGRFRQKDALPNLTLVEGRMESFDLAPRRFALVYSAFRAFQHLTSVEDQLACLVSVRRHLRPGGLFAFDVFSPRLDRIAVEEEPETEDARFRDASGAEVVRSVAIRRDVARQTQEVLFRFDRRPPGGPAETFFAPTSMRWFFRYELEHLLARAGLTLIELFGRFDRSPFAADSPEMILIARP
ncbi:class I SAM-dependent methyltransferase [soil metagenome]